MARPPQRERQAALCALILCCMAGKVWACSVLGGDPTKACVLEEGQNASYAIPVHNETYPRVLVTIQLKMEKLSFFSQVRDQLFINLTGDYAYGPFQEVVLSNFQIGSVFSSKSACMSSSERPPWGMCYSLSTSDGSNYGDYMLYRFTGLPGPPNPNSDNKEDRRYGPVPYCTDSVTTWYLTFAMNTRQRGRFAGAKTVPFDIIGNNREKITEASNFTCTSTAEECYNKGIDKCDGTCKVCLGNPNQLPATQCQPFCQMKNSTDTIQATSTCQPVTASWDQANYYYGTHWVQTVPLQNTTGYTFDSSYRVPTQNLEELSNYGAIFRLDLPAYHTHDMIFGQVSKTASVSWTTENWKYKEPAVFVTSSEIDTDWVQCGWNSQSGSAQVCGVNNMDLFINQTRTPFPKDGLRMGEYGPVYKSAGTPQLPGLESVGLPPGCYDTDTHWYLLYSLKPVGQYISNSSAQVDITNKPKEVKGGERNRCKATRQYCASISSCDDCKKARDKGCGWCTGTRTGTAHCLLKDSGWSQSTSYEDICTLLKGIWAINNTDDNCHAENYETRMAHGQDLVSGATIAAGETWMFGVWAGVLVILVALRSILGMIRRNRERKEYWG